MAIAPFDSREPSSAIRPADPLAEAPEPTPDPPRVVDFERRYAGAVAAAECNSATAKLDTACSTGAAAETATPAGPEVDRE